MNPQEEETKVETRNRTIRAVALGTVALGVMAGAAPAVAADQEVILRLLPAHTDAMVENYNPNNPGPGAQQRTRDFTYEPLWIDNVWHPGEHEDALAVEWSVGDDLKSVTYKLRQGGEDRRRHREVA